MFEKVKQYGKAYIEGTKTALDPERIKQEMHAAENLKFAMPNASTERLPSIVGLVPGEPVDADEAARARAATIAPYRATQHGGAAIDIRIDRFFSTQAVAAEAIAALARTGLDGRYVFGLYPSTELLYPDRYGSAPVPWEWCLVHAGGSEVAAHLGSATGTGRAGGPAHLTVDQLLRVQRWLDRPRDLPFPHDEEVAGALLARAGIDPADCLGLSRLLSWQANGYADNRMISVEPAGVQVITGGAPRPPLSTWAPVPFGADAVPAVRVDLLDWTTFALAGQPIWTTPPQPVTRFPQLPARPEELLVSYLEIVGLVPADVYGVSLSVREQQSGWLGPAAATAERGQAASIVTVAYRDRDAYAAGRARFEQYRAAHLAVPLGVDRDHMGRLERAAIGGIKAGVRQQMGRDAFDEHLGDEAYDADMFPYLAGPLPR